MFVVDTNILLYAANSAAPEHETCRELVQQWRAQPTTWYTSWGILYEFLRVATHPMVFRHPWNASEAWRFVAALLASPGLRVLVETDRHAEVAAGILPRTPALSGNLLFDAHTAVLMHEHGVRRIYTRDTDFHRFSFLEVLDPLAV